MLLVILKQQGASTWNIQGMPAKQGEKDSKASRKLSWSMKRQFAEEKLHH